MNANRDQQSLGREFLTPWRWRWQRWFAVAGLMLISYAISAPLAFVLLHETAHPAWVDRAVEILYFPLIALVRLW